MKLRARLRRWRVGGARYERAVAAIAYDPEAVGRAQAYNFIRKVHAEHPNPARRCSIPDCCEVVTSPGTSSGGAAE